MIEQKKGSPINHKWADDGNADNCGQVTYWNGMELERWHPQTGKEIKRMFKECWGENEYIDLKDDYLCKR